MKIRKSKPQDIGRIMEIYGIARDFMEKHGNPNQWGATNWPPTELIANDIENGNSYVCSNNNKIIATFFFVQGKDIEPTYAEITNGSWIDDALYGVIHRIASDGTKRGVGSFCINWAYEQCNHLRIDTHVDNLIMQNLLEKLGFIHCGTIYVEKDNYPRLAYEKQENRLIITNFKQYGKKLIF
ncbi:GNAT family N-acetyltransferase [Methanobrevibacter millerae]|uniref:Acetyltransferase GNAT family n=1 Tax=Methanobrevibacter millerae TaxID=230361 RepID=A0A0U3E9N6_9EURY|nr:N-acetyltransferase [Methanobrevibacter millerae]ALT69680.1 acetyltransferase GNAT family [Methanobrevibacter millerae]